MSSADLAGIDSVVAKIIVSNGAVLKANKTITHHNIGVEIDLYLCIQGNGLQRTCDLVNEQFTSFTHVIDIGVEAIPVIGKLFHERVVVVIHAETDGGQGHTFLDIV